MKTVKVRIAVAVDPEGKWNACGWSDMDEDRAMELACEPLQEGEDRYWVTAELPILGVIVIKGQLEH